MMFFFDRNWSPRIAKALDILDAANRVVHQNDDPRFTQDSEDVLIIGTLANTNPRPALVTGDLKMRRKVQVERKALKGSGLHVVFFRDGFTKLEFWDQTLKVMKAWPAVTAAVSGSRAPTALEVTLHSKVKGLGPTKDL